MTRAVAVRQRPLPRRLREKAERADLAPQEYLLDILGAARTNEEAARSIGVSRNTLWRWCRRLDVTLQVV